MKSPLHKEQTVEGITVAEFYRHSGSALKLQLIAGKNRLDRIIGEKSLNRPALALTDYFRFFAHKRVQVLGAGEMAYLRDSDEEFIQRVLEKMARRQIPCFIISRNLAPTKALIDTSERFEIPLFRSPLKSKSLTTEATLRLEELFAPRTTLHGTLLDVRGIGVVITGRSGIGKSEAALGLIERGHSLVADDLVHVRLLRDHELVGTGTELTRGYMECRGIGIIDISKLFGIRSVRIEKRIDLIISYVHPDDGGDEDRTGLDQKYLNILDTEVPHIEIPVRPGRDMARLTEVAAMVQALRQTGHNAAEDFNQRLINAITGT
ncbi:MAG: HPr(Ser) kinase/phosphatase [Puniceicoccaceae bacterium]